MRAGVPKIEVTFDLDANGIVKVSARDMDTGKEQGITITGSSNLSEDEIQKAMRNAAAFAGQDQERKAALEAFNAAEAALYRVNTALGSKAGKAPGPGYPQQNQGRRARTGKGTAPQKGRQAHHR